MHERYHIRLEDSGKSLNISEATIKASLAGLAILLNLERDPQPLHRGCGIIYIETPMLASKLHLAESRSLEQKIYQQKAALEQV